jgi:hypothetical protein
MISGFFDKSEDNLEVETNYFDEMMNKVNLKLSTTRIKMTFQEKNHAKYKIVLNNKIIKQVCDVNYLA